MDGHLHFVDGGFQLASVDLRPAESPAEFIARLKAFAAERRPGEWILGRRLGPRALARCAAARAGVDRLGDAQTTPCSSAGSTATWGWPTARRSGWPGSAAAPGTFPAGVIVRDRRTGEPTGMLKDEAKSPVYAVVPGARRRAERRRARAGPWSCGGAQGVTAVAHVSVRLARARRPTCGPSGRAGSPPARRSTSRCSDWRRVADTVGRDRAGRRVGLESAGSRDTSTARSAHDRALLRSPTTTSPPPPGFWSPRRTRSAPGSAAADSAGLQVAVHAIGERANGLLLDDLRQRGQGARTAGPPVPYRACPASSPRGHRPDLARSGVVASMQPYHAIDDGRWAEKRIGPERIKTTYAFRSLLDRGPASPSAPIGPWRRSIRCSASTPR